MAGTARHQWAGLRLDVAPLSAGVEATAPLHRVHGVLIRMARSDLEPETNAWDVVVDSSSAHAKRGGALTGPNPK